MADTGPEHAQIPEGYWILGDPQQREVMKRRSIVMVRAAEDAGTVIFLDKTARPLGYLFRLVFPTVYPDKKIPEVKFINLGTEKMTPVIGIGWHEATQQAEVSGQRGKLPGFMDILPRIQTKADLEAIYGQENIEALARILRGNKSPEKRLIVDEVE